MANNIDLGNSPQYYRELHCSIHLVEPEVELLDGHPDLLECLEVVPLTVQVVLVKEEVTLKIPIILLFLN